MYVCICNSVTDGQIKQAVEEGASSMRDLRKSLKVATCCGRCATCARQVLNEARAEAKALKQAQDFPIAAMSPA